MSLLETENVAKRYGGIQALDGCSVSVSEGAITGLIGPNGSGKTTLFNVISGYASPESGAVRLDGRSIAGASPSRIAARGLGRTFQITRVFTRLTLVENLHVAYGSTGFGRLLSRWSSTRERREALEMLDFVGLAAKADEAAGSLSFGQRKLLELAIVLHLEPRVVLLDEPASGVNPSLLLQIADRIREINASRGVTFYIVEHNVDWICELCSRLTVMSQGKVIATGPPDAIREDRRVIDAYLGEDLEYV